jgi:hypothetical protein
MKKEKNNKENYEHFKALLSYGDITNIANNTGFCRGTVYNVLNGCSKNGIILSEIVKILEKKSKIIEKFNKLL